MNNHYRKFSLLKCTYHMGSLYKYIHFGFKSLFYLYIYLSHDILSQSNCEWTIRFPIWWISHARTSKIPPIHKLHQGILLRQYSIMQDHKIRWNNSKQWSACQNQFLVALLCRSKIGKIHAFVKCNILLKIFYYLNINIY